MYDVTKKLLVVALRPVGPGLQVEQDEMLHKSVMRREVSDAEPGKPIEKTQFEKVAANEREPRRKCGFYGRRAAAVVEHLPRTERCVSLSDHPLVMLSAVDAEMKDIAGQVSNPCFILHLYRLMYHRTVPSTFATIE